METLDFESLVTGYYENLVTTLRNFSAGPEFLETWVHDEDPERSLLALFEAAEAGGVNELTIKVSHKTALELNRERLVSDLSGFGELKFQARADAVLLHLNYKNKNISYPCHPAYQSGLQAAAKRLNYEGKGISIPTGSLGHLFSTTLNEVTLYLHIDENGIVRNAKHQTTRDLFRPLMDKCCELLMGRPIQEAADHATIRLEIILRDVNVPPPVPGLVTPENADAMFAIPQLLLRNCYRDYLKKTGGEPGRNNWEDPLSLSWQILPVEAQKLKITNAFAQICERFSLPYQNVEVLSIKNGTRVELSCHEYLRAPNFGHHLMLIEAMMKKEIEPRLELILESLEDRNKRETRTTRDSGPIQK